LKVTTIALLRAVQTALQEGVIDTTLGRMVVAEATELDAITQAITTRVAIESLFIAHFNIIQPSFITFTVFIPSFIIFIKLTLVFTLKFV
jgi:hypothetical protein